MRTLADGVATSLVSLLSGPIDLQGDPGAVYFGEAGLMRLTY